MSASLGRVRARTAGFVLAGLLSLVHPSARSQPASGYADTAQRLIESGRAAQARDDSASLRESVGLFKQALAQLDTPAHLARFGGVLNSLGDSYRKLDASDSARSYFTRALDVRRRVGEALPIAISLYNLGMVLYDLRQSEPALAHFLAAAELRHQRGDRAEEGAALAGASMVYHQRARADSARALLNRAESLARAAGDSSVLATVYEVRASVLRTLNQPDSAAVYLGRAIAIHQSTYERTGQRRPLLNAMVNGGPRPGDPGGDEEIRTLTARAAEMGRLSDHRGRATALDRIGTIHRAFNRPAQALDFHRQALAIQQEVNARGGMANTLSHIAAVFREQGQRDSAVVYYVRAIPLLREVGDARGVANAQVHLGSMYEFIPGRRSSARSVAYYDSAAAVIGELSRAAGDDPMRVSFAENDVVLYHLWVIAWLRREREVGRHAAAYAALAASERGRAQALRDLMRRNASDPSLTAPGARPAHAGLGADLPVEGRELARKLARGGVPIVSYLVTGNTLFAFLVRPNAQVEVFRTAVREKTLEGDVRSLLWGLQTERQRQQRSRPTHRGARVGVLAPPGDTVSTDWHRPAAMLSALLFPPGLLSRLPDRGELVIVPSGVLAQLPFALLPLGRPERGDTLLGLRYALRYAPSLRVLADLEAREPVANLKSNALVLGDPTGVPATHPRLGRLIFDDLRVARAEADSVALWANTRAVPANEGTETLIRARLGDATLVHLATHARVFADDSLVRESFILLGRDAVNDGLLTVGELLDQGPEMNAGLVVLSACETGLGDLKQAEGMVGMQRAFLARGARGLLVSLWDVDDDSSFLLMRSFYDNLSGRKSRAEALRLAQATVMGSYPQPWDWAAFQLIGVRE